MRLKVVFTVVALVYFVTQSIGCGKSENPEQYQKILSEAETALEAHKSLLSAVQRSQWTSDLMITTLTPDQDFLKRPKNTLPSDLVTAQFRLETSRAAWDLYFSKKKEIDEGSEFIAKNRELNVPDDVKRASKNLRDAAKLLEGSKKDSAEVQNVIQDILSRDMKEHLHAASESISQAESVIKSFKEKSK